MRTSAKEDEEVIAPCGKLQGTRNADGVGCFRGIPYAQPPVGPLRFAAPRPPVRWTGSRTALQFSPAPIQEGHPATETSEDCLYLNVYVPPPNIAAGPYPVMMWVYGGGNMAGSSGDKMYDLAAFARSGVVTVTLNYRVGALGFLELGDVLGPPYAGSGSNALRDLSLGLRWIYDNISAFGGDPNHITVAGESAGAKNVAALVAAPQNNGMIRRAIIESGSGQTVHTPESAHEVTRLFLHALEAKDASAVSDKARLFAASAAEILHAQKQVVQDYPHNFPFRAVVGDPFLPQSPVEAFASGAAHDMPLLIGTNRDESRLFFPASDARRPIAAHELSHITVEQIHAQRQRYQALYPDVFPLDMRIRLLTAEEYWIPSVRLAEAHAASSTIVDSGGGATYMYRFDHVAHTGDHAGYAVHASELPFVWQDFPSNASASAIALSHQIHRSWVAFITNGVPRADGLPPWPVYAPDHGRRTLLLNDPACTIAEDPGGAERLLWEGVL